MSNSKSTNVMMALLVSSKIVSKRSFGCPNSISPCIINQIWLEMNLISGIDLLNTNQPPSVTKVHFGWLLKKKKKLNACSGVRGCKSRVNVLLLKESPLNRGHLYSTREIIVSPWLWSEEWLVLGSFCFCSVFALIIKTGMIVYA